MRVIDTVSVAGSRGTLDSSLRGAQALRRDEAVASPPATADPASPGRLEAYRKDGLSIVKKLR